MGEDHVEHHHLVLEHIAVEAQLAAVLVLEHSVGEPGLGIAGTAATGHRLRGRLRLWRLRGMAFMGERHRGKDPQAATQHQPVKTAHAYAAGACLAHGCTS